MAVVELSSVGAAQNATYPKHSGNKVKLYGLASEDREGNAGAFHDISQAIDEAKHFIFIADWSFHPYVRLKPRKGPTGRLETVGAQLQFATVKNKATDLLVAIHAWNHTSAGAGDDLNDSADRHLDFIAAKEGFPKRDGNLLWRISSRSGFGFSLHQKFVVLDALDNGQRVVKAFFGGLDLTKGRFDFGDHPILPPGGSPEPCASSLTGRVVKFSQFHPLTNEQPFDDWYNAEFGDDRSLPREPWNDYYGQVIGPAAWDIAREFVGRWNRDDQGEVVVPVNPALPKVKVPVPTFMNQGDRSFADRKLVEKKFVDLFKKDDLKKEFEDHGGSFTAQVVRSLAKEDWGPLVKSKHDPTETATDTPTRGGKTQREFTWRLGGAFEKSIQEAYLHSIATADRFIYIETQYLIGSGAQWDNPRPTVANEVPGAIVKKIVQKINEGKPFHAYLVVPMFPEGDPVGLAVKAQRQFQFETMRFMAKKVAAAAEAKKKDWKDFLSFYFLANWTGVAEADRKLVGKRKERVRANKRYMVYVHSKLMIIDDEFVILGSANLNERSLAGDRDAEICVALFADEGKLEDCKKIIKKLRTDAWARHLGGAVPEAEPETADCAIKLRTAGINNWGSMSATSRQPGQGHLINLTFDATSTTFKLASVSGTAALQAQDAFIFDAESKAAGPENNGTTSAPEWSWDSPTSPEFALTRKSPALNIAE